MRMNYVNADHVHTLIDFPTNLTLENLLQLLKGGTSYWINKKSLVPGRFAWARGYSIFAVSQSNINHVHAYIANQNEHHRRKTFLEEYQRFISSHELVYYNSDKPSR